MNNRTGMLDSAQDGFSTRFNAQQRSFLKSLTDRVPDFLFYKDAEGRYLGCNAATAQYFFGMAEEEIIGKKDLEIIGNEILAKELMKMDRKVLESGESCTLEESLILADGSIAEVETIKTPFFHENGEIAGLIGIARDVTARKKAEAALRQRLDHYLAVAESSSEFPFIIRMGEDGQRTQEWISGAVADISGSTREEPAGLTDPSAAGTEEENAGVRQEIQPIKKVPAPVTGPDQIGVFSNIMHHLLEEARSLHLDRTLPVLIEGETGTGKEIMARLVHFGDLAGERNRPFIDLNCAAINSNLFESELFGYEAGAYTNAAAHGQKGKLDLAQGGSLFLDEIGELSGAVQAKLLRVLQEREYYRVGGLKKISTDARIICATNVELEKRVHEGLFRADLYYRLCVGRIRIPPLRERRTEIIPLAELFLKDFARRRKKLFNGISRDAARMLVDYHWPGNIRELKNLIEMTVFKYNDPELSPRHLKGLLAGNSGKTASPSAQEMVLPFPEEGFSLKEYNTLLIQKVLAAHNYNRSAAARYLGISRRALLYKLEGIDS